MKNVGVVRESCMPFGGNKCPNAENEKLKITNYGMVAPNINTIKDTIVNQGPVTAYLIVCGDFNSFSGSGIYSHSGDVYWDNSCWNGPNLEYGNWHSISLIGYDDVGQYWIAKNSWGTGWGDGGYIKISYSQTVDNINNWWNKINYDDNGDSRILFIDESINAGFLVMLLIIFFLKSGFFNELLYKKVV
jgi:hypothetical protein